MTRRREIITRERYRERDFVWGVEGRKGRTRSQQKRCVSLSPFIHSLKEKPTEGRRVRGFSATESGNEVGPFVRVPCVRMIVFFYSQ